MPARHRLVRAAVLLLLAASLAALAARMAFLCDDAYITFRYVANAHDGLGLVWNPPPFRPVEGYTGFLWALVLWATWSWCGVEPPAAAHWLSIGFGLGQFVLIALALCRLRRPDGVRWPLPVVVLALAAVVGNRTFLQWLTSGLETALFNFAVLAWVLLGWRQAPRRAAGWLAGWSLAAAVAALTRPDGLLFAAVTVAVALVEAGRRRLRARDLLALTPLLAVALHVGWRRRFYGEWLPNTYYAKVAEPWPEAGLRYLACFLFEHGTWLVAALAVAGLVTGLRRGGRACAGWLAAHVPAVAAVGAVCVQVGYYTVVVGGDHFEYRVFSHLVPLGALAVVALVGQLGANAAGAAAVVAGLWLAGGVGWLQAWAIRDMAPYGFRAVADLVPAPLRPAFTWYDRQQVWLRVRLIGIRCREHAQFLAGMDGLGATRLSLATDAEPYPVCTTDSVGYVGWILRDTCVLDPLGLNDWVVARAPRRRVDPGPMRAHLAALFDSVDGDRSGGVDAPELRQGMDILAQQHPLGSEMAQATVVGAGADAGAHLDRQAFQDLADLLFVVRRMAHDCLAPAGYIEGFRPNVTWGDDGAAVRPRARPLSAAEIRQHEATWWETTRRARAERR